MPVDLLGTGRYASSVSDLIVITCEAKQKNMQDNTQPEIKPIIHTQLGKWSRINLFILVSLKTGRFVNYWETPVKTKKLNIYDLGYRLC